MKTAAFWQAGIPFSFILALMVGIQQPDVRRVKRLFSAQELGLSRFP